MSFNHSVQDVLGKLETLKNKVNKEQQKTKELKKRSSHNLENWNSNSKIATSQVKEIKKYKNEINDFFQAINAIMVELINFQTKIKADENKVMLNKSALLELQKKYNQVSSEVQNTLIKWDTGHQTTFDWQKEGTMYFRKMIFTLDDLTKYLEEQNQSLKTGEDLKLSFFEPSRIPPELLKPEILDEEIDKKHEQSRKEESPKDSTTQKLKE